MKPLLHILLALCTGCVISGQAVAACAPAQILRNDVLVVVNDNSISSPQVGDYYCEQRGINPANIAHVRVPVTNDVELDQFISLRDQLIKHMQENTLPQGMVPATCNTSQGYTRYYCPASVDQLRQYSRIRYLVTTKGIPIRFRFTDSTLPFNVEASVDNYLRFWLTNYFSQDTVFTINHRAIAFGDGRGMRGVDPVVDRELIVGRIDGVDIGSARRLVDRAIDAERNGIYGKLYGNRFGGSAEGSGPEGAYWKSWLPTGGVATVYPSWRYLHGLFGDFQSLAGLAVRHIANPACLSYDSNGKVPGECVTAVNIGGIGSFPISDEPPGTPWGRIPAPDNALVFQGYIDTFSVNHDFNHLLNWRDSASCNTLCSPSDAACKAASTDAYKEIDTRCVRVAEGFMGYEFKSYPLGMMASWPTGWYQSTALGTNSFDLTGGATYYLWEPEVRNDEGFDDNHSLWYRDTDNIPTTACYTGTEDYQTPPGAGCKQDKRFIINQSIFFPEQPINLANPQKITVRFKYRALDLNRNVRINARLLVRESAYDDGIISISTTNQVAYDPIRLKSLIAPDDPANGVSWGDAVATFSLDPSKHRHPQYLYDAIKISILATPHFEGQFAIDTVSVEEDGVVLPLVNPSFNDGHRQLSGGDSAASFLSRLNGAAFWGNISHHESNGHSFESHPYETLIYFLRGLPLGDAVWFAENHNAGILYGDPVYSPVAVHLHYLLGSDNRAPKDNFYTASDSPLALTGDTLNGTGTDVTTTYSVDFCSGNDFLPCDQNGSWLPVSGVQNLPGGQRNMPLGNWDISGLAAGDYVLRLAVTSANSTSGLSQTFYDYYPVTLYTPLSDTDADGLSNQVETGLGTDLFNSDTDADGLPDGWEVNHQLDPLTGNTNSDSDNDGFTDIVEFLRATDPSDSQSVPVVAMLEVDPVNGVDNGQSPFKSVFAANSVAQAGDTIMLLPGDYFTGLIIFNSPVYLKGPSGQSAVLHSTFLESKTPGTVVISDLAVTSAGLQITGQALRFERVTFNANIDVNAGATVEFVNSVFANASGDALDVLGDAGVVLENSTLTANDVGIRAGATGSVRIINSIISGNTTADLVGVPLAAVSYSLTGNVSFAGFNGNIIGNPLFVDPQNGDYHLQPNSPAVDAGDPQSDFSLEPVAAVGRINMGRYGNTAEATIASLLSDADADGLSDQQESLLGTDPLNNDTDADGLPDGWEVNHQLDPLTGNTNSDSDNDGFTDLVEYARATDPSDSQSVPVVAMLEVDPVNGVDNGQSPFKSVFAANSVAQAGDTIMLMPGDHVNSAIFFKSPVYLKGPSGQSAVLHPIFLESRTPGTVVISDLAVTTAGLQITGQALRFERVTFNANIDVNAGAAVEFVNSVFANASGDALNVLGDAGVVLENSTLTANDVGMRVGATGSVRIINSIISGNTTADLIGVPLAAVSYALTGNVSFAGFNGNIIGNPLFVDPQNGDYHLQPNSPAVDAGDPQSDFSLEPVAAVGRINMGRYGNTAEAVIAGPAAVIIPSQTPAQGTSGGGCTLSRGQVSGALRVDGLLLLVFYIYGLWRLRSNRRGCRGL